MHKMHVVTHLIAKLVYMYICMSKYSNCQYAAYIQPFNWFDSLDSLYCHDCHCQRKHHVTRRYCNAETPTATATCRPFVPCLAS